MVIDAAVQSLRMLRRHKRFAILAIVSLGVAIALNTTMYSVLDAMIRPKLTIHEPDRLYGAPYFGDYRGRVGPRQRNHEIRTFLSFYSGAAGRRGLGSLVLERGARLSEGRGLMITPNYFRVLGVRPSGGRLLGDDDVQSSAASVVLSERMWRRLFPEQDGFEPAPILIDGAPRMVVGVLPYEADYPGEYNDVWIPASAQELPDLRLTIFRLKEGVTPAQADAELKALNARIVERTGEDPLHAGFLLRPWIQQQFRLDGFYLALIGAVVAVLLIACANLANLQLARGVARTRELATRAAVGASRAAIIRQLVGETAWLAVGGLLLGAILTAWGMKIVEASVPDTLAEYVTRPQMSWRVALFAGGTTVFCLVTVGLLPAMLISRVDVNSLLKSGAGTGQSKKARRQYAYLVVVEVGLALTVLCSAGLLTQAALSLRQDFPDAFKHVAQGFAAIRPVEGDLRTKRAWSDYLIQQMLAEPEVTMAATAGFSGPRRHAVTVDDRGGVPRVYPAPRWSYYVVSPDFLRLMGIQVLKGRDFAPGEFAEPQVIVDERTAALLWRGEDPVGRLIKLDSAHVNAPWLRVIGVAKGVVRSGRPMSDERRAALAERRLGEVWVLNAHDTSLVRPVQSLSRYTSSTFFQLFTRTDGDVRRLTLAMRRAGQSATPGVSVRGMAPLYQQLTAGREKHDFMAGLFNVFGICALALAALGVYAVISHGVAQRTREFGVRVAVGASAKDIRELVIREGTLLTLVGIVLGLIVVWNTAGTLRAFLFSDWDHYDSRVFAVVALALFGAAWLASWIPARRATRINPVEALRSD